MHPAIDPEKNETTHLHTFIAKGSSDTRYDDKDDYMTKLIRRKLHKRDVPTIKFAPQTVLVLINYKSPSRGIISHSF